MKSVTAYVCDFCPRKKRYSSAQRARIHEDHCYYNPVRQACATCKFFTFTKYYYEHDTGYGEGGPFCEKDMLNNDPESSSQLRSECDGWERRDDPTGPLVQKAAAGGD